MPYVALVAALFIFAGCSGDECVDLDEDGFGVGGGCEATDCDDSDALHHADCLTCSDPDKDGRGFACDLGTDCAPSNDRHWADCGNCTDADLDGRGEGCDLGIDCDENDPDQHTACGACVDADGDGNFVGCDAFVNRPGPDCDDADPDNYLRCGYCTDADGDSRFTGCDRYVDHQGPDCNDMDANNWDSCLTCRDADGDTYSTGCNAYTGALKGPDCNDANGLHWSDCGACTDSDLDGRGAGCNLGTDCLDTNRDVWVSCGTCADADLDSRWAGCDAYFTHLGPDCNDGDPNAYSKCATCLDIDTDGQWSGCDLYTIQKPGPDCNDNNSNTWSTCFTCRDNDLDTYYASCDAYVTVAGPDCGDSDQYNWTSCSTCTDTDGDGRTSGCDSYPMGTVADCDPSSGLHWADCGVCVDNDGDGRGAGCDLGTDCDDTGNPGSDLHWSDCMTCDDDDLDGWGIGTCDVGSGDCDDNNPDRNQGAADTTINGIDENCDLLDGIPFVDDFEDNAYAPQWTAFSGDTFIQSVYRVSGSYALNLGGGSADVQSAVIDTSACASVTWRYYGKRGPEQPDFSEDLNFQYWTGTVWAPIESLAGGTQDASFNTRSGVITAVNARHAQFRVRYQTFVYSGTSFDDYYIDDVSVGCAVDTDLDLTADLLDCAPLDPEHWSDCSTCVDNDNDGYGTSCNLGTDCADFDPGRNPGELDATVDGIDQNCNGVDGTTVQNASAPTVFAITDGSGDATGCGATGATTSPIVVSGAGTLFDVDVGINVTHPVGEELDIWLQYTPAVGAPVCVQLTTDNGLGANFTSTLFSDQATTAITAGTSPFTGAFLPESVLSALDGKPRAGTYTLFINDDTATSSGTLDGWDLVLTYY